jgi:predicted house-cleaning noncanonical NTP pyrophosphatase (MazG superfamily)
MTWIKIHNPLLKPKTEKQKSNHKTMFVQKKVNVFFDLKDVKNYIDNISKNNADEECAEILQAIKEKSDFLAFEAEKLLKKKHNKKIKKGYLHSPINTAMDEIAKKDLQELIYELGVVEIASIVKMAMDEKQD